LLIFYETYESTQHQWALTLNPLNQAKKLEVSYITNAIEHFWQIPINIIPKYAKFSEHQNGHILISAGSILQDKEIKKLL
jgi:hypothetical protein